MEESPIESGSVALWVVWMTVWGGSVLIAAFRLSTLSGGGNVKEEVVLDKDGARLTGLPMMLPLFSRCAGAEVVTFSGLALGGTSWWSPWLLGINMTEALSPDGSCGE